MDKKARGQPIKIIAKKYNIDIINGDMDGHSFLCKFSL